MGTWIRSGKLRGALCAATLVGLIAGCSSNNNTPAANDDDDPPETIQGIATPSSVAVVTATHAE